MSQAETPFRESIVDIYRIYVRNATGEHGADPRAGRRQAGAGPAGVVRYNGFRAVGDQRRRQAGLQLQRGARRDGADLGATLPAGYSYEWTGTAFRKRTAGGQTGIVLGLAVLFAYLFLVALYESWNIPIPVLLSVSVGVLGAIAGVSSPASPSMSTPRSVSSC